MTYISSYAGFRGSGVLFFLWGALSGHKLPAFLFHAQVAAVKPFHQLAKWNALVAGCLLKILFQVLGHPGCNTAFVCGTL